MEMNSALDLSALLNLRTPTPTGLPRTNGIRLSIETDRLYEALHKEFQTAYALEILLSDIGMNDTDLLLHEV